MKCGTLSKAMKYAVCFFENCSAAVLIPSRFYCFKLMYGSSSNKSNKDCPTNMCHRQYFICYQNPGITTFFVFSQ